MQVVAPPPVSAFEQDKARLTAALLILAEPIPLNRARAMVACADTAIDAMRLELSTAKDES